MKAYRYITLFATVALSLAVFAFWYFVHPEYLNHHEQNQLFLFTTDYLAQRIAVAGGVADWLAEFVVQFYYTEWIGAAMLALLFGGLFWVVSHMATNSFAALPAVVLLLWHTGNHEVLLSYHVSLLLSLLAVIAFKRTPWWADIAIAPCLYWAIGPLAWLYVITRIAKGGIKHCASAVSLLLFIGTCYAWIMPQYQLSPLFFGINYCRIPMHYPTLQFVVPIAIAALLLVSHIKIKQRKMADMRLASGIYLTFGIALLYPAICQGYDKDICELLKQDMLLRESRWKEIVERAEKYEVPTPMSSNVVNLALAMQRQLAERQFEFYQSGPDALVMPAVRDNMSNIASAEIFFRIGMVNEALRYYFDTQKSILNGNSSGRFSRRIAECYIANGNYAVARKYLTQLSHTLFYGTWAKETMKLIEDEDAVNRHPLYGKMRKYRLKEDFLYSYNDMESIFMKLFDTCHDNKMALDYFFATLLAKAHVKLFFEYLPLAQEHGDYRNMPSTYRDVANLMQGNADESHSPYAKYIQQVNQAYGR